MGKEDISLILLGAGKGRRFGKEKQFETIRDIPVILIALQNFKDFVSRVYIVLQQERKLDVPSYFDFKIIKGGERRQDSVWNALLEVNTEFVIIHDGARPLVSTKVIREGIEHLKTGKNAIPGIRSRDTIREWNKGSSKTVNRDSVFLIQTPQFFITEDVKKGYEYIMSKNVNITDDASSLEYIGKEFLIFEGDPDNIKITYKKDIKIIDCLLKLNKWGIEN